MAKPKSTNQNPALSLVDDVTLDTFLREPSNVRLLPVPPGQFRREFQRMIVSAFLAEQQAA